jgi:hypothetical protein
METQQTQPQTEAIAAHEPQNTLAITAFIKAQKSFGAALKTSTNPHFRSKYADLSACVEAVIDGLHANNLALIQCTQPSESGVSVETILLHESGGRISGGVFHVPASKQDPQGYGSALTYARRYSLMATCGIAPEDDDGNAASKKRPPRDAVAMINAANSLLALQATWASLTPEEKVSATAAKDARKDKLSESLDPKHKNNVKPYAERIAEAFQDMAKEVEP